MTNFNSGQVFIVYDGDGNRVKKITSTSTVLYLVDTHNPSGYAQVLEEKAGSTTTYYTYGPSLISQRAPNSSTNYFVYDGHGSTRLLIDNGRNAVNVFTYDAYGTLIASNALPQTAYLYCGQQYDLDLGLYYNRARYLNPNTGRFWSLDTFEGNQEEPLSLHKYIYGTDNPVNNIDPSGNDDIGDVMGCMDIGAGLDASHFNSSTASILGGGLPIETVGDAEIDGQLNKVYNNIEQRAKRYGPIPKEPYQRWMSLMRSHQMDAIYKGTKESHYRYQYNGSEHPMLLDRIFINSDLNYIGFREGCCARGWDPLDMTAGIIGHLALDYWKIPSFNTFAAAQAGYDWATPKFQPQH